MRLRDALIFLLGPTLVLLAAGNARADQVSIGASRDNTLYEEDGDASNGLGQHMFVGRTNESFTRRALVHFDVAGAIPPGSTVDAATLTLVLTRTRTGDQTLTLHRVLEDWGEGTSVASGEEGAGGPATSGDATWSHAFWNTEVWSTPGGVFEAVPSAQAVVGNKTGDPYSWSSAALEADVQGWLDGTLPNHGWILVGNETAEKVVKRFDTKDSNDTNKRPVLAVTFTPPAATGACCAVDGSCSVVLEPGATCAGTYQGVETVCEPNSCPQPVGACCLPDAVASCTEVTDEECDGLGGGFQGDFSTCGALECPVVLTRYLDPLPRPAVAQPVTGNPGGAASYELAMRETQQQLHSELPPTTVWGFDAGSGPGYPGPTIEARKLAPVTVTWRNDLRDTSQPGAPLRTEHYLPVDTCPHGATENQDARTVVHLHGGHVSADADGYPEDTFPPGQEVVYEYPNDQLPSTLWYHDHALGITRLNVYMGLAGFYLLRDDEEDALGLPSGEFEVPLAIQDRSFRPDGSLVYPATWQEVFFGDSILVNGKAWPYLDVKQGKYRFRLLNGSTSRTYALSLSTGAPFQVIGAEGGLLPAPTSLSEVTLGPGERSDVIVDFAPYPPGTEVLLLNSAPAPFPGDPGVGVIPEVMKFVVGNETGHTDAIPGALRPMEVLEEADATVFREFHLAKGPGDACSPFLWEIHTIENGAVVGSKWDDITEFPSLGATEVWKYVNRSGMTHPMHMHLVMFQVLDRQAFDDSGGTITPIGSPVPPPPHEAGWKDTVQVGPNEIVRVIARFTNPLDVAGPTYLGRFPYHCHILEHEDHEMMRQFETNTVCGDGVTGRPDESCDDGGTASGDGCSPLCQIEECSNGIDDDGDGLVDAAEDPGCEGDPAELSEFLGTACDNGVDDDGDGAVDLADPGCRDYLSNTESPQCDDGIDNDGDGTIDFVGGPGGEDPDPNCGTAWDNREARRSCGLGFELALLTPALLALRRRRARRHQHPGS